MGRWAIGKGEDIKRRERGVGGLEPLAEACSRLWWLTALSAGTAPGELWAGAWQGKEAAGGPAVGGSGLEEGLLLWPKAFPHKFDRVENMNKCLCGKIPDLQSGFDQHLQNLTVP